MGACRAMSRLCIAKRVHDACGGRAADPATYICCVLIKSHRGQIALYGGIFVFPVVCTRLMRVRQVLKARADASPMIIPTLTRTAF